MATITTVPNQQQGITSKKTKAALMSSYIKRIGNILETAYAQLFLCLIKTNSLVTKKTKISKGIGLKQNKQANWMAIYLSLALRTKRGIDIPKMTYKYLYFRANLELKFLFEEAKKLNCPFLTFVDVYLSKMKHHVLKLREKQLQEQRDGEIQYNAYGFRKIKTAKTIRMLPEENSDEDEHNDKKEVVTQQMNKLKKESKAELDEILQSGQLNWGDKYKHIKSKYMLDKNSQSHFSPSLVVSSCVTTPKYKSAPLTTTNKYKTSMTDSKAVESQVNKEKRKKKLQVEVNQLMREVDDDDGDRNDRLNRREKRNLMTTMFNNGDFYYM